LYRARRFGKTLRELEHAIELNPSSAIVNWFLSLILLHLGDHERAREAVQIAVWESNEGTMYLATLGCVLARAGKRDGAVEVLRTPERRSSEQYVSPLDLCIAHPGFKDHRPSLSFLEKAVEQHVMKVTGVRMPLFDPFRNEPRFIDLSRSVELVARHAISSGGG
jgi:hypothetical protein